MIKAKKTVRFCAVCNQIAVFIDGKCVQHD